MARLRRGRFSAENSRARENSTAASGRKTAVKKNRKQAKADETDARALEVKHVDRQLNVSTYVHISNYAHNVPERLTSSSLRHVSYNEI